MERWLIRLLRVNATSMYYCIVPALHQGNRTNVDKLKKRVVMEGDFTYNQDLMKEQNISKGCLVNNANVVLCMSCRSY